jgi:hypothetical protein
MSSSAQNQGGSAASSRRKVAQAAVDTQLLTFPHGCSAADTLQFDDAFRALCAERGPYIALNRATQRTFYPDLMLEEDANRCSCAPYPPRKRQSRCG